MEMHKTLRVSDGALSRQIPRRTIKRPLDRGPLHINPLPSVAVGPGPPEMCQVTGRFPARPGGRWDAIGWKQGLRAGPGESQDLSPLAFQERITVATCSVGAESLPNDTGLDCAGENLSPESGVSGNPN